MPLVEDQLWILPPRVYVGVGNGRFRVSLSPYSRAPKHAQLLFLTHTHTVPHCSTPLFFAQTLHDLPTIAPPTPSFYFPTLSTLFSTHTRRVCAMRPPPLPVSYLHLYCQQGFHRKALDVANKIGISNSLLRVIERREGGDKLLIYGGMCGILFFIWVVWRYALS